MYKQQRRLCINRTAPDILAAEAEKITKNLPDVVTHIPNLLIEILSREDNLIVTGL